MDHYSVYDQVQESSSLNRCSFYFALTDSPFSDHP